MSRRTGRPKGPRPVPFGVRLMRYLPEPGPPQECALWKGATSPRPNGYPVLAIRVGPPGMRVTRVVRIHRWLFQELFGPIPDYLCVCHRCNNKRCLNPAHLYLATAGQNSTDAAADGLFPGPGLRGETHGMHQLTEEAVREIRRRWAAGGVRQQDLAADYGVAQGAVSFVLTGKTWRHVT